MRFILILSIGIALLCPCASWSQSQPVKPIYVISDLHFGIGAPPNPSFKPPTNLPCDVTPPVLPPLFDPKWLETEDFRWPVALCGFLQEIGGAPTGAVLVIAGDFLELWQHPQKVCVVAANPECGCSLADMKAIVGRVILAHSREFAMLRQFLSRNMENRLVIVPGNHDAALMHDDIWKLVADELKAEPPRLVRAETGTWMLDDKRVVVEHGHQQHVPDVNAFPNWDTRKVTVQCGGDPGQERFYAPWGENFVSNLYTPVEYSDFPLIDNLVPDSLGIAVYFAQAKAQSVAARDVARFLYFNVFETSARQKEQVAGASERPRGVLSDKEVDACVKCIGDVELVLRDARRHAVVASFLDRQSLPATSLENAMVEERERMLGVGAGLPQAHLRLLCQREADANLASGGKGIPLNAKGEACPGVLSTAAEKLLDPHGAQMLQERVESLRAPTGDGITTYIFGHTHEAKLRMDVKLASRSVSAFNTGAFHRQIDEPHFRSHPKRQKGESDPEFLKRLTHNDLGACYAVVSVTPEPNGRVTQLRQWFQPEDHAEGQFIPACDYRCSSKPANCEGAGL